MAKAIGEASKQHQLGDSSRLSCECPHSGKAALTAQEEQAGGKNRHRRRLFCLTSDLLLYSCAIFQSQTRAMLLRLWPQTVCLSKRPWVPSSAPTKMFLIKKQKQPGSGGMRL